MLMLISIQSAPSAVAFCLILSNCVLSVEKRWHMCADNNIADDRMTLHCSKADSTSLRNI